jgi:hypothetical protein
MVALFDGTGRGQCETARDDRMHWPEVHQSLPARPSGKGSLGGSVERSEVKH